MSIIKSRRPQQAKNDGKSVEVLRALTPEDARFGELWDPARPRSVVRLLDTGEECVVLDDEIKG